MDYHYRSFGFWILLLDVCRTQLPEGCGRVALVVALIGVALLLLIGVVIVVELQKYDRQELFSKHRIVSLVETKRMVGCCL